MLRERASRRAAQVELTQILHTFISFCSDLCARSLDAVDKGDFTKLTGARARKFSDFVSVDLKPLLV